MMSDRHSGWYWVRLEVGHPWEVAKLSDSRMEGIEDMWAVVGPRIPTPDELERLKAQRNQLREALIAIQTDGAWIEGEWVPSHEAESLAEAALNDTEIPS